MVKGAKGTLASRYHRVYMQKMNTLWTGARTQCTKLQPSGTTILKQNVMP